MDHVPSPDTWAIAQGLCFNEHRDKKCIPIHGAYMFMWYMRSIQKRNIH